MKDFSSVCVSRCVLKLMSWLNFFKQVSHVKDFSPVCVHICILKLQIYLYKYIYQIICIGVLACGDGGVGCWWGLCHADIRVDIVYLYKYINQIICHGVMTCNGGGVFVMLTYVLTRVLT